MKNLPKISPIRNFDTAPPLLLLRIVRELETVGKGRAWSTTSKIGPSLHIPLLENVMLFPFNQKASAILLQDDKGTANQFK